VYTSTHPDPVAMAGTTITDPTVVGALWKQDNKITNIFIMRMVHSFSRIWILGRRDV
jgi:hypothetical protein